MCQPNHPVTAYTSFSKVPPALVPQPPIEHHISFCSFYISLFSYILLTFFFHGVSDDHHRVQHHRFFRRSSSPNIGEVHMDIKTISNYPSDTTGSTVSHEVVTHILLVTKRCMLLSVVCFVFTFIAVGVLRQLSFFHK